MDSWSLLIAAGALQGLLLSTALLYSSSATASRLLAALVACLALILGEEFLDVSGLQRTLLPYTTGLTLSFELLIAPLVFLYARAQTDPPVKLSRVDALHFLPFVLSSVLLLPFYLQSGKAKLARFDEDPMGFFLGLILFKAVFLFSYLLFTLRWLYVRQAQLQELAEGASQLVAWYRRALVVACCSGAVSITLYVLGRFGLDLQLDSDRFSAVVLTTALYGIAFASTARSTLHPAVDSGDPSPSQPTKYQTSPLSDETARALCRRVVTYLEVEEPYREGDYRLQRIASDLGIPAHHVSQILNQQLGKSFNELINHYRVEAAKASLAEPDTHRMTILDVAFAAGFNSKASFHRVFKKHTGMTPSQFRRRTSQEKSLNP